MKALKVVTHDTNNYNTWEVEAEKLRVIFDIQREFKTCLGYLRPYLKKKKQKIRKRIWTF